MIIQLNLETIMLILQKYRLKSKDTEEGQIYTVQKLEF